MSIALYHFHVTQIKRSAGQSAIASAAYRSGEKLHSEYYGEDSDYTKKGGVICSEILLPPYAPPSFSDRETLWNEVEKAERGKKAQLAYSFDIALQNEFSMQENIELARQFLLEQFVSGAVPTPWNIGGKHGLNCAIRSLRKRNWTAGLTTAAMSDRASTSSLLSMRV